MKKLCALLSIIFLITACNTVKAEQKNHIELSWSQDLKGIEFNLIKITEENKYGVESETKVLIARKGDRIAMTTLN